MINNLLRRLFAICMLTLSVSNNYGQEALNLTLKSCIQYAEEHNLTLKSGELDVSTAEIQLKQTRLQMAPSVNANASQNFGYSHGSGNLSIGGSYGISAGIDIFNGLSTYNSIRQSQLRLTQAQLQVEQAKNQIRISIIRSYLTILMNQEMADYQREVLNTSRQQVNEGEQKFKVGQILESDYLLLQAQYLSDSVNIENTKIAIANEYVMLRNLLKVENGQSLTIVVPDSARLSQSMSVPSLEETMDKAMNYLPELKMKNNSVEMAEYDVKIAKSAFYPSLSANAGISTGYNAAYGKTGDGLVSGLYDNLGENIGLNLSIPIYNQSKARNNVKMKNIAVQQAQFQKEDAENQVRQEIEAYHLNVKKAYNNYTLSEMQEAAYYANFKAYTQRFQYGAITAVDLLQQQTNYLNILNNFMQNKYNFLMEKKVLDVYMGQEIDL